MRHARAPLLDIVAQAISSEAGVTSSACLNTDGEVIPSSCYAMGRNNSSLRLTGNSFCFRVSSNTQLVQRTRTSTSGFSSFTIKDITNDVMFLRTRTSRLARVYVWFSWYTRTSTDFSQRTFQRIRQMSLFLYPASKASSSS